MARVCLDFGVGSAHIYEKKECLFEVVGGGSNRGM